MMVYFFLVIFSGFDVGVGRWIYVLGFNISGLLYDYMVFFGCWEFYSIGLYRFGKISVWILLGRVLISVLVCLDILKRY